MADPVPIGRGGPCCGRLPGSAESKPSVGICGVFRRKRGRWRWMLWRWELWREPACECVVGSGERDERTEEANGRPPFGRAPREGRRGEYVGMQPSHRPSHWQAESVGQQTAADQWQRPGCEKSGDLFWTAALAFSSCGMQVTTTNGLRCAFPLGRPLLSGSAVSVTNQGSFHAGRLDGPVGGCHLPRLLWQRQPCLWRPRRPRRPRPRPDGRPQGRRRAWGAVVGWVSRNVRFLPHRYFESACRAPRTGSSCFAERGPDSNSGSLPIGLPRRPNGGSGLPAKPSSWPLLPPRLVSLSPFPCLCPWAPRFDPCRSRSRLRFRRDIGPYLALPGRRIASPRFFCSEGGCGSV